MNIIQKIISETGMSIEEVKKRVLDKQRELANLISKKGAAHIVAKELGLNLVHKENSIVQRFEKNEQRINELKNEIENGFANIQTHLSNLRDNINSIDKEKEIDKPEIKINRKLLDELH